MEGLKVLRAEIPEFGGLFAVINMLHWLICENKMEIVKKVEEENISLAKMHQSKKIFSQYYQDSQCQGGRHY